MAMKRQNLVGAALFWLCVATFTTARAVGSASVSEDTYMVGVGKADITGPAADVQMMGYAMPEQLAGGIHTRLFARAFIFAAADNTMQRVVYVNIDACMASQLLTLEVIAQLKARYGDLYTERNVAITGIHTHAGPAGFLQYVLYTITSLGFVAQTFDAMRDGIVQSIVQAHDSMQPARLRVAAGELLHTNINRSPTAYANNPADERAQYQHDQDKTMTLLQIVDANDRGVGALTWFPVHCTSMNNTNKLISGDNKGIAAQLMETWARDGDNASSFSTHFAAAFAQSNVGDTSPNTQGAFCLDTGEPCDMYHSTCNGRNELCHGRGPAWPDDFASTHIIAQQQTDKAIELWHAAASRVAAHTHAGESQHVAATRGSIDVRHAYVDMCSVHVRDSNVTRAGDTCPPAIGFSMAAGTTDGPGAFDFQQGDTKGNAFWKIVRRFLHEPTAAQQRCHHPKPILLDTGSLTYPYAWQPCIVDISIIKLAQLIILCVPGEFTTMAGRRLRNAVYQQLRGSYGDDITVVISGLTNTYSSYITTYEEYQIQRYEGAFTIYGPHTLDAYIQEMGRLAGDMQRGEHTSVGPPPPNLRRQQWSLLPPVVVDEPGFEHRFGDVLRDASRDDFSAGDTVEVVFQTANPRNNLRTNGTFVSVQLQSNGDGWQQQYDDNDISTRFYWTRPHPLSPQSHARVTWTIPHAARAGVYRICHYGTSKTLFTPPPPRQRSMTEWMYNCVWRWSCFQETPQTLESYHDFEGCSRAFKVQSATRR